ncbi:MAG: hypothetical protein IJK22_09430 [Bacteroidales bacterium]|nr:hypothetical protein [Bacteroidales bacterium]
MAYYSPQANPRQPQAGLSVLSVVSCMAYYSPQANPRQPQADLSVISVISV